MTKKYAIGIDFGTLSGRVVLVDITNGEEIASDVTPYPHGVIVDGLPQTDIPLEPDSALQHPEDYLEVLRRSIPAVLQQTAIEPNDIIGIGIDFTTCTMMPIDANLRPLCSLPEFRDNPHAWVKLWKHHSAQEEATRMNEVALQRGESFLVRYGGKLSSEWMLPKIWETLNKAPQVFEAADLFVEAADWVVAMMTGTVVRNSCMSGFKASWNKQEGYPNESYLRALDERLADLPRTKLRGEIKTVGARAGTLTAEMAQITGLAPGTTVAVAVGDAHAGVIGAGAVSSGQLLMAMGTSTCHMLLHEQEVLTEGISGVVMDGIVPGLFAYEAGQAAVGDIFGWFVDRAVPSYVVEDAKRQGISVHEWLETNASRLNPGESGLLALDWWNGNRSVLVDAELSGLLLGYTLSTKPEDIYRALIEATAFGTRRIIDQFKKAGLEIKQIITCGGLPQNNQLLMQIYADVLNAELYVADSTQTAALGAAIYASVAAGQDAGGYPDIQTAASRMTRLRKETYQPHSQAVQIYNQLYEEYLSLHDWFGRGGNDVMKKLRSLKSLTNTSN